MLRLRLQPRLLLTLGFNSLSPRRSWSASSVGLHPLSVLPWLGLWLLYLTLRSDYKHDGNALSHACKTLPKKEKKTLIDRKESPALFHKSVVTGMDSPKSDCHLHSICMIGVVITKSSKYEKKGNIRK